MQASLPFSTKAISLGLLIVLCFWTLVQAQEVVREIQVSSLLDGTNGAVIYGGNSNDLAGKAVASGDFNGDGYDDMVIGAWLADGNPNSGDSKYGEAYVVFGSPSGLPSSLYPPASLDGTNGFTIYGRDPGDELSAPPWQGPGALASGDFNGDGIADILLGAHGADGESNSAVNSGEAYIVFGKASGWTATQSLSSLDGSNGLIIYGRGEEYDHFASGCSSGDFNGDGIADILLGSPGADGEFNSADKTGEAYVVFGKASGWNATMSVSSLDGSNGLVIYGRESGAFAGLSVSSADVNGDGYADILIGAYGDPWVNTRDRTGEVYCVFGKASGWTASMNVSATLCLRLGMVGGHIDKGRGTKITDGNVCWQVLSLDGSNGLVIFGTLGDGLGEGLSGGDFNGDGFADLILGARYTTVAGVADLGAAYVVFGKASGWPSSLSVSSLDATTGLVITGSAGESALGTATSSGDFNGDGYTDLLIGVAGYDGAKGGAYVVFGRGSSGWPASLSTSSLDGSNGLLISGRESGDQTGSAVSSGDYNGDGLSDMLIGAWTTGYNSGEAYVVFGKVWPNTTYASSSSPSSSSQYNATYAPWLSSAVSQAFSPHAACNETRSWEEILAEFRIADKADRYTSGGLGSFTIPSRFGIWVCWRNHPCIGAVNGAAGDRMCYVKNKVTEEWHAWGLSSVLGLCDA